MKLDGKKVLVTGGAGFIGSHIIDLLIDEGCAEIVAVDNMVRGRPENLADALAHGPVRLLEGDIRDRQLMEKLVKDADVVFHQAALRITQCAEEPRDALEVMVDATYDLLELCVKHPVEKVVAASSASVYGMADQFPIAESTTLTTTAPCTGPRKSSTRACCAASMRCTDSITWPCAISMSMARAWTFMACIPRY